MLMLSMSIISVEFEKVLINLNIAWFLVLSFTY